MPLSPSLTNIHFKQFQRQVKQLVGVDHTDKLLCNVYFCHSYINFYLSTRHIELMFWYLKWKLKKSGVLVFCKSCTLALTKKPAEIWMGKGKGPIVDWGMPVKKTGIPFYLRGKPTKLILKLLIDVKRKLPIPSKIVLSNHWIAQVSAKELFVAEKNHFINSTSSLFLKQFSPDFNLLQK